MVNPRTMPEPKAELNHAIRLLHLEDDPRDVELLRLRLEAAGLSCDILWVSGKEAFESALDREEFDLVLSDYNLPDYDGMLALARVRQKRPELPVIMISGGLSEEEAVDCLKAGATDYVLKQRLQRLGPAVRRALAEKAERAARRRAEEDVSRQRAFLRQVIDLDRNLIFAKDGEGRFVLGNQAVADIYGTTVEGLLGHTDADFNPNADQVEQFRRVDIEVMDTLREVFIPEEKITDAAGKVRWMQTIKRPIIPENGVARMVLGVATDITERRKQAERLARLGRIRAVMSGINAAIVRIRDRQELFREACRIVVDEGHFRMAWAGIAIPGMSKAKPVAWSGLDEGYLDEVGLRLQDAVDDHGCAGIALREKRPVIVNDIAMDPRVVFKKEALVRGYHSLAVFPLLVQGSAVGILVLHAGQAGFFDDEEVTLLEELAGDLSFALDYIAKTDELNYLAYYDVMTGLANRRLFFDRLNQLVNLAREESSRTAVLVIDIDRFRFVNSSLGRRGGDAVLRLAAERLTEALQASERLGRVGANSFAVVLSKVREEADIAGFLAGKLIPSLGMPLQIEGQEVRISVKAGIALFPGDGADAEALLRNAEAALEKAKSEGERYLFYAPQMNERVAEELTLETKLRNALDNEQFVLHYQPKLDLATGRMVGLEALLRWNDPDNGLVPPGRFIPILEETGMILEVGKWVMQKALIDYRSWRERGLQPPRVAVNVSPIQLRQKTFVAAIQEAIRTGAGDAHGLDLEITESVIMGEVEENIAKLEAVRNMGINVAIDDFGTGYSSLSYLARLPVNALKIDRSFVLDMARNPESVTIVSTIISLAHSLNIKVIAEGVETEEQSRLLKLLRCDQAQGYLFGRPVPPGEVPALLRKLA